jgi:hypothetical protein
MVDLHGYTIVEIILQGIVVSCMNAYDGHCVLIVIRPTVA